MPCDIRKAVPERMRPTAAVIDELAGEASAGAEEGVGRAAEMKAARLGLVDELAALLEIDGEGLFREDVLAGAERRERHAEMRGRAS